MSDPDSSRLRIGGERISQREKSCRRKAPCDLAPTEQCLVVTVDAVSYACEAKSKNEEETRGGRRQRLVSSRSIEAA